MASTGAAINAELVLQTDHVGIAEVEKVSRPQVRVKILLGDLESYLARIVVTRFNVVDRHHAAFDFGKLFRNRTMQILGERGNATFPREIITDKRHSANF